MMITSIKHLPSTYWILITLLEMVTKHYPLQEWIFKKMDFLILYKNGFSFLDIWAVLLLFPASYNQH